jgi:hypothetical protein
VQLSPHPATQRTLPRIMSGDWTCLLSPMCSAAHSRPMCHKAYQQAYQQAGALYHTAYQQAYQTKGPISRHINQKGLSAGPCTIRPISRPINQMGHCISVAVIRTLLLDNGAWSYTLLHEGVDKKPVVVQSACLVAPPQDSSNICRRRRLGTQLPRV